MTAASGFKKYFSKKGLTKLFVEEIRYKSAQGIDHISTRTFEERLQENLEIILRKVCDGTYQFSQYREKLISRGPEKYPRLISIPTIRDKLVQKALAEILRLSFGAEMPLLHIIINEVILTYQSKLYDSVLRLDVKDFYPSIVHIHLLRKLRNKIRKKEILHLVKNAISRKTVSEPNKNVRNINPKGVPQGLSISNILANVYLSSIDAKYFAKSNLKYFRYVDDILVFCNETDIEIIHAELVKDFTDLGLDFHGREEKSSKSMSGKLIDGFGYLGYEFQNNKVTVRKKSINKLHESIINLFTNYKYSKTKDIQFLKWALDIRITGCIFNKSKYGWLFFFSQIDDLSQLGALDHFIQTQLKWFNIEGIKPKTFLRTYHEITQNLSKSKYVPNFDQLQINEKERILKDVFKLKNPPTSPHEIEYQFNKRLYKMVTELERDLGRTS
jgi:RNA-directed DNA polymerase